MLMTSHGSSEGPGMAKPIDPFGLKINTEEPLCMHIDMNSCFATVEQQANPLLRGRPVAVSAYDSPRAIIIAPSIEAKAGGIKLGMSNAEGRVLCPDLLVLTPDPPKYRDAHIRFRNIFMSYTDNVTPKSIDEAVIDFKGSQAIRTRSMVQIGHEIRRRVKQEIGEWMKINVGIGPTRFLAKTAAGLNKPEGLDVIDYRNILDVYGGMQLRDITGINIRNEARLNAYGIFTPIDFFNAPLQLLKKQVFQSINGYYWYCRLRGYEMDNVDHKRRTFGHTYALGQKTADKTKLAPMLMKLCEKTGRRLRGHGYYAKGVHVAFMYEDRTYWHKGRDTKALLYSTQDIFRHAMLLYNLQPHNKVVTNLTISVYGIVPNTHAQVSIFDGGKQDVVSRTKAFDMINNRYGEFTISPAEMLDVKDIILDRIAFGGSRDLEDLYVSDIK